MTGTERNPAMPYEVATPPLSPKSTRGIFMPTSARVLLADDDAEMRALLAYALRSDGYEVLEAADGGRLLVAITDAYEDGTGRDAFDLVISDVRMPIASGLAVLESLRKASWRTPVILMTAFGDELTRKRAESLGAVLFDKPFDVDDLRTIALNLVQPKGGQEPHRSSRR
jgi:DNA-binding response OmpR family regulator